jgi:hypothetical protein
VQVGEVAILLGGDLEETSDDQIGWSAIIDSTERPRKRAIVFKVPHHGSGNAHHEGVWTEMLVAAPYAILTPWNRGRKLPTPSDVTRITSLTRHAYSTAKAQAVRSRITRPNAVVNQLNEMGARLFYVERNFGAIRLRNGGYPTP